LALVATFAMFKPIIARREVKKNIGEIGEKGKK
jgi:hypothetical protein